MNPSYNSGSSASGVSNTSGVKPGMIASTSSDSAPEPMQLSGNSRGGKKGLLAVGLLIIVLLIVGVIVAVMMGGGKGGNSGSSSGTDNDSFSRYANYLLYGTENSKDDLGDFDKSKEYAVVRAYVEDNANFFVKAQELWKVFYEKIKANEAYSETSKMVGDVNYQNELMDFVTKYMSTVNLDDNKLLKLYLENGSDKAKSEVDDNYKTLTTTIFEPGKEYAMASADYAKKTITLYSTYDSYGCIVNDDVDSICLKNNEAKIAPIRARYISELPDVDNAIIDDVLDELIDFCFRIRDDFGEKND